MPSIADLSTLVLIITTSVAVAVAVALAVLAVLAPRGEVRARAERLLIMLFTHRSPRR